MRAFGLLLLPLVVACGEAAPPAAVVTPEPVAAHEEEGHVEPAEAHAVADANGWEHYGAPFALTETVAATTLLADPAPSVGKTVRVEGKVSDVCQKAGCWMVIADGDKLMRIRMKDHSFAVAKDGTGALASIEGEVVAIPVKKEDVEHFASESAKPEALPENQAVNGQTYEIVATGVAFKRS